MDTVQILEKEGSEVNISHNVVGKIVEQIISDIDGAELFNVEYNAIKDLVSKKPFTKSIKTEFIENTVKVSLAISVMYGKKIKEVASDVQERITQEITALTGIEVDSVNVTIVSII